LLECEGMTKKPKKKLSLHRQSMKKLELKKVAGGLTNCAMSCAPPTQACVTKGDCQTDGVHYC